MEELFNVKMRSSKLNKFSNESQHISGAERISNEGDLEEVVKSLVYRAINHEKGKSDFINISIDKINKEEIIYIPCIDVITIESQTPDDARAHISQLLRKINIEYTKAKEILGILDSNFNMRGAMLLDLSGIKKVDVNKERGIRATGIDWRDNLKNELEEVLEINSLNNNHVKEALALASKVIYPRGVLAEICISDDPNYTTGYVSIKDYGYFRITNLKEIGSKKGGRIILFDSRVGDIDEYINFLENSITIVNKVPKIE